MTSIILNIPNISCGHCARTITNALTPVKGLSDVQVNIPTKQVRVEYDETRVELERLKAILQEKGYPVVSVEGSREVAVLADGAACGLQESNPVSGSRVTARSCCNL